jgi:flagellar hook-length control protein FliK
LASLPSNPDLPSILPALATSPANPGVDAVPAANADLTANLPQVQPSSAQDGASLANASAAATTTPTYSLDVPIQPITPAALLADSSRTPDAAPVRAEQVGDVNPQITEPDKSSAPSEAHNDLPEAANSNVFLGSIQPPIVQASAVPLAANAPVLDQSNSHEKVSAASKASTPQTAAIALTSTPGTSGNQLAALSTLQQPLAPSARVQAEANQQQAQNREKLALEITARLHSPLGDALSAPAPVSATGVAGAPAIPNAPVANGSTSSSTSSDSVKPANSDSGSSSASQSGSGDSNSQNPNASPNLNGSSLAVANGSGAFAIASADFSRHVATPEAMLSPQTSADTTSTAAAQRPTGTALLTAQQPALPSSLPASLNDVVQASRLYQRVGGAEMHIAMDTDLLGSIDLRAVVHQSGLTATIGVQHADVQALLSSELPGLQHALSQKNLHVEQISIFGSAVGSQSNQGGSQSQQQKHTPAFAPQATAAWPGSANGRDESLASVSDAAVGSGGTGRLSVHA